MLWIGAIVSASFVSALQSTAITDTISRVFTAAATTTSDNDTMVKGIAVYTNIGTTATTSSSIGSSPR